MKLIEKFEGYKPSPGGLTWVFPKGFYKLTKEERDELKSGRCTYREYEGTPILDYTKT